MTKTIIIAIIAMVLIGHTIHRGNKKVVITDQSQSIQAPDGIQVDKTIQAVGTVQQDNNFPIYTHTLLLENQARIGLRSANINLNHFLGYYEVFGTIHTIEKGLPSIDIKRIRNPLGKIRIQDNIYHYLEQGLMINLEKLPSIHSTLTDDTITIISDNTPLISIQKLSCEDNTCISYLTTIENQDTKRFVSSIGHTFYQYDTQTRVISDKTQNIYIIQGDEGDVIDFSTTIELLDATYIIRQYKSEIFTACNELENIVDAHIAQEEYTTILTAQGTNTKNETLGCTISLDLWDNKGITNVSLF